MSETESFAEIKVGSERSFGFVFAAVFGIVGLWPAVSGDGQVRLWSLGVAAAFIIVALARPIVLRPLNILWFKFGILLGKIIGPIVMALLFFVAVTPVALVMRLLGKDPLRKKPDPEAETYWLKRSQEEMPMGTMKNQF